MVRLEYSNTRGSTAHFFWGIDLRSAMAAAGSMRTITLKRNRIPEVMCGTFDDEDKAIDKVERRF